MITAFNLASNHMSEVKYWDIKISHSDIKSKDTVKTSTNIEITKNSKKSH